MAEQQINVAQQDTLEAIDNKIDILDAVADNIYAKVDSEVAAIKTKTDTIGATSDTGGSATAGTIMGKLNKIINDIATFVGNWTSTRAGYIDTIKANTDRLTSARATIIDNIGATGNTGGTTSAGTVMAKLNAVIGNTATNNTASKTGILSAKLAYLISLLENTTYGLSAIKTAVNSSGGGLKSVTKTYSSSGHNTATGLTQAQYAGLYSIYVDGTVGNGTYSATVKGYGNLVPYDLSFVGSNGSYSYQSQNTYNNNVWRVGGVFSDGYSISYYHLFVTNNVLHPGFLYNYNDFKFTGSITYYYFA